MLSKAELAKELINSRRRVGEIFALKIKRMNRIVQVLGIAQFNSEAAVRYNKAMDEYRSKTRKAVPSRAEYFFYNRDHKERNTGYVLAVGSKGHKWFALKREAEAALLALLGK